MSIKTFDHIFKNDFYIYLIKLKRIYEPFVGKVLKKIAVKFNDIPNLPSKRMSAGII